MLSQVPISSNFSFFSLNPMHCPYQPPKYLLKVFLFMQLALRQQYKLMLGSGPSQTSLNEGQVLTKKGWVFLFTVILIPPSVQKQPKFSLLGSKFDPDMEARFSHLENYIDKVVHWKGEIKGWTTFAEGWMHNFDQDLKKLSPHQHQ